MSHDTQSLTISQEEASRVEDAAKRRLLASRKLILVVDLDQTIIQAAVDPTIGEWQKDPNSPNYEAVKDVRSFQLTEDVPGIRSCWYFIKLRPGLMDFLERIAKLYELHIYTMGTRQYAQQIAKLVDPHRKYFGDRILSRDESGSMTAKSLQRLFPIDTKMVVIIDDRGDVWKWSDNLVKVSPFEFFPSIGDINSSFLPKKQELRTGEDESQDDPAEPDEPEPNGTAESDTTTKAAGLSAVDQLVAMSGGEDPIVRELQTNNQDAAIASQVSEKPLLQMQKKMDEEDEAAAVAEEASSSASSSDQDSEPDSKVTTNGIEDSNGQTTQSATPNDNTPSKDPSPTPSSHHPRHSILHNNDRELTYLEEALTAVHNAFYKEYDRSRLSHKGGRVATLANKRKVHLSHDTNIESSDLLLVPDVKQVMPAMKRKVLNGVYIVFSGVMPLHTDIQNADISVWAKSFGAIIDLDIKKRTTHVIAARPGTAKVKQAMKRKGIKIVTLRWLLQCFSEWRKVNEVDFLLDTGEKPQSQHGTRGNASEEEFLNAGLSSSEDDSDDYPKNGDVDAESENGTARPTKRLRLNINSSGEKDISMQDTDADPEEEDEEEEEEEEDEDDTPLSPLDLDATELNSIDQELKDFLGSDADTDSETESIASSQSTTVSRNRNRNLLPNRKRKRFEKDPDSVDTNEEDEDGDEESQPTKLSRTEESDVATSSVIHQATISANEFNTVPAGILNGQQADDTKISQQQQSIESTELENEANEEDSDDELERELERELEEDEAFDRPESEEGFMIPNVAADDDDDDVDDNGVDIGEEETKGNGNENENMVNDIEEDHKDQTRSIDSWNKDLKK